jgi:hypothetical protein
VADLSAEFGWQPGAWRTLGWRELQAWVAELGRRRKEEQHAQAQARAQQARDKAAQDFYAQHGIQRG